MPVYNGERFLERTVDSILQQTLQDFELVISDNASADRTRSICEAYAAKDPRVRYIRQPQNIGAIRNYGFVARAARAPFFKWSSANDLCHPTLLEKCVDVLRRDSAAVLCYGGTCIIDGDDKEIALYEHDLAFEQMRPSERFIAVRSRMNLNNASSGVIRREVLDRAQVARRYPDGDMILMAELALYGAFRRLPDVLLYRRMDPAAASRFLPERELREFLDPAAPRKGFISWRRHFDCAWTVLRSPIAWREKAAALDFVLRSAYWDRGRLWQEVRMGGG
jgi:glycosyltransferase involved in cell wall biosynthesis